MPFMFLRETARAYRERDPAARSMLEVWLCSVSYTHLTLPTKRIV